MYGNVDPNLPTENLPRLEQLKFSTDIDTGDVIVRTSSKGTFVAAGFASGKITKVSLNPTTWSALPPTPFANRNTLSIQNRSGQDIIINYVITDSNGWLIPDQYERNWPLKPGGIVYAKSTISNVDILVEELA